MADESLDPQANITAAQLEAMLRRVDQRLTQEEAAERERAAKADAREARAQARAAKAETQGTTRARGVPTEKAAIDEATLSTERLVKANAEALAAVRARVAEERVEGQVIARNAEATAAAASRVEYAARWRVPSQAPAPTPSGYFSGVVQQRVQTVAAQQQQEELYAARWEAQQMGRRGRLLGPGPAFGTGGSEMRTYAQPPREQFYSAVPQAEAVSQVTTAKQTAAAVKEVTAARQLAAQEQARSDAAASESAQRIATLDRNLQYLSRSYNLAGDAAAKHGLLTSETINYMLKGQISARQFGNEIAGTITKFAGWTAAATATYGIIGILSQFTKGAIAAASGVGLVSRVMNNVDSSKLQQSFRDLSAQFNLPIEDVVQAVYGSAKVFNDQTDAITGAKTALFAMKVGELDAAKSTQTLNAIVNGFGLTASELPAVFDAINQAQNKFGGNTGQIALGVAKAAGSFRLAGGSYRELIALIETGTKVTGATGETVGTALARSASRVLTPQGAAALRGVGIKPGGPYGEILQQAFDLAKNASPEQVNAIARALVPSGGQFARILVPLLQNRALYNRVTAGTTEEASRGSAQRELAKALGQPNEQMRALVNGVERLGAAFAQAGGANGLLIVVKALQTALTLTTSFVEAIAKIPGIQVALPFIELLGVLKVLRFFNLGGSLPTAPAGGVRARLQGLVTQSPDRQFATQVEKDQGAVGQLAAQESQAAQLRARRATLTAKRLELAAQDDSLSAEDRVEAQRQANIGFKKAEEATQEAALLADETAAIAEQNLVYDRARKAGMTAEQAATKAGIYFRTGTIEYGKGGTPEPIGGAARPTSRFGAEAGAAGAVAKDVETAGVAIAATAVATKKGALESAEAAVASEEATRVGWAKTVLTTRLSMTEMYEAVLLGFQRMRAAAIVAGPGGIAEGAVGVARVGAMTGLRGAGGAIASVRTSLAGVSPLVTGGIVAAGGYFLIDQAVKQAQQYGEFLKVANARQPDFQKEIDIARENAAKSKPGALLADIATLQPGKLLGGALQADQDLFSRFARTGVGGVVTAPLSAIFGGPHETRNQQEQDQARQAQDERNSLSRAQSVGMLMTQSQISARVRQRLAATTSPGEQLAVYQKAIDVWEQHSLAQLTGGKGALAARDRNLTYLKGQVALVLAREGDFVELSKVLADGTLKAEDLTKEIQAQIGVHGLTARSIQFLRRDIAQSVDDVGTRLAGGDPAGAANAVKNIQDAQQAVLGPAQQDLQDALSVATTPEESGAARKKFLEAYRQVATAPLISLHRAQRKLAEDEAQRPTTPAGVAGTQDDIRIQTARIKAAKERLRKLGDDYNAAVAESEKSQRGDEFSRMDAVAGLQESRTTDPVAKERIALANIDAKIAKLRKAGLEHSTEMIQLYTDRHTAEQQNSDLWLQRYDDLAAVADSAASIGATPEQNLNRQIMRATSRLAAMRAHGSSAHDIAQQTAALNGLLAQQYDMNRQTAQALADANIQYRESGTEDPVKIAEMELQKAKTDATYARTPLEKVQAATDVRSKAQTLKNAKIQDSLDTINFNLSMETIDKTTAAAEILALSKRRGISKQLRRSLLEQYHSLLKDAQGDSSAYEVNVGNIKLPTAYEVMRGIGEAHRAGAGSTSRGNVHATTNATINVVVANRHDVGKVSDALDQVLTTHVRSTLRAKGVLGG